jgi:hypothetical protein
MEGSSAEGGARVRVSGPIVVLVAAVAGAVLAGCGGPGAGASSSTTSTTSTTSGSSTPSRSSGGASATTSTAGLRTTPAPWDRPADQAALVRRAGLTLTPEETLAVHYHAHLDVLVDGSPVQVPAGLGINVGADGQLPEHGAPGIAPLHTHDTSGVLHIEAPRDATFTLGQVFTEWGVALSPGRVGGYTTGDPAGRQVAVYVDGERYAGDPTRVVLKPHEEIAVVVSDGGSVAVPKAYSFPAGL